MKPIRHIVSLNLIHDENDPRTREFFDAAKKMLGAIPCVAEYHHYKQVLPDTPFKFGFVLEFKSEKDFIAYCEHPLSLKFTKEYWEKDVLNFIDNNFVEFD